MLNSICNFNYLIVQVLTSLNNQSCILKKTQENFHNPLHTKGVKCSSENKDSFMYTYIYLYTHTRMKSSLYVFYLKTFISFRLNTYITPIL